MDKPKSLVGILAARDKGNVVLPFQALHLGGTDAPVRKQHLSRPLINKEEPTKGRMFWLCEIIKGMRVGMGLVSSHSGRKAGVAKTWAIREKLAGDGVGVSGARSCDSCRP